MKHFRNLAEYLRFFKLFRILHNICVLKALLFRNSAEMIGWYPGFDPPSPQGSSGAISTAQVTKKAVSTACVAIRAVEDTAEKFTPLVAPLLDSQVKALQLSGCRLLSAILTTDADKGLEFSSAERYL